ncbi:MAG TPA: zinc-binding dehydrogenase [Chloroflexota bacterium]|nr:zinc-binding dehydrogenase [Chloroflexota bacterium]
MAVRAVVMPAPDRPLEVREFADPALESGAVLLETLASEVCGTDVHVHHGALAGVPYPLIPGHVSVGRVRETRGAVRDVDGDTVRPGDVVTFLDVHRTCGRCWYCQIAKATTRCPERRVYGITYGAEDGLLGGWSERIVLLPGVHIVKLPAALPVEVFMAGGCGLPTALHAVQRGEITFGDSVVIQGAGPVGLCAVVLAQLQGASQVIVLGGPSRRLEVARALGADTVIDIASHDEAARGALVRAATGGRGADVTIEATGVPSAVAEGLRFTRDAGTLVVVGQYTDHGPVSLNPHTDLNRPHLQVRGCWGSDLSHLYRAVRTVARHAGDFPWQMMISGRYELEGATAALEAAERQESIKSLILPNGPL